MELQVNSLQLLVLSRPALTQIHPQQPDTFEPCHEQHSYRVSKHSKLHSPHDITVLADRTLN